MARTHETTRLIRLEEVRRLSGLSRSHLYALIQRGEFPSPVKISIRAAAWVSREVDQWVRARIRDRDSDTN